VLLLIVDKPTIVRQFFALVAPACAPLNLEAQRPQKKRGALSTHVLQ
jgi:hypothetical protein